MATTPLVSMETVRAVWPLGTAETWAPMADTG